MEKLTRILAIALDSRSATQVLDKAATLASTFRAHVEVMVHDPVVAHAITARCSERNYENVTLYSVAHSHEPENETVLRRVWSSQPDLVVKAPARDSSDWDLANECPAPVLLVRQEAWRQPVHFVAAVDVSDDDHVALTRGILHAAGFLALGMHGHLDILYSEREARDEAVRMKRAVLLAQIVREFHVGCERLQMFSGEPGKRLPPLIASRRYDVLILGASLPDERGRDRKSKTVQAFMDDTHCDVVLVRAPSAQASLMAEGEACRHRRAS